jgi:capsid protein
MHALVSAFFTVFVRNTGGMQTTIGPAFTADEALFGQSRSGPNSAPTGDVQAEHANDLEMGYGNVMYLDENTDITMSDPHKVDTGFSDFWEALGNQVTAVGGMPFEKAMMKYTTSYTAARAAAIDSWRATNNFRTMLARRLCSIAYEAVVEEAVLRGRVKAPGFFDDALIRRAWCGSYWVGIGQGSLNPLQEAKAAQVNLANLTTTYEQEYMESKGGRWDAAMQKRARENRLLQSLGIQQSTVSEKGTVKTAEEEEDADEMADDSGRS